MKKLTVIAAVLILSLLFAACAPDTSQWDAADLSPSADAEPFPGLELAFDLPETPTAPVNITGTFTNTSDIPLESGGAVGRDNVLIFIPGLEVKLDGVWYSVPHEEIITAGVGLELSPGASVSGKLDLSPFGRLPDGQYRALYTASPRDSDETCAAYAYFDIADGLFALPTAE